MAERPWVDEFRDQCLQVPGEHLLVIGKTGAGKTQILFWVLDGILECGRDETVVWFDTGKSAEILRLATFAPVTIWIPDDETLDVVITQNPDVSLDIRVKPFKDMETLWTGLQKGRINVICIEPFILDPMSRTTVIQKVFSTLIRMAHDYRIITPLAIFYDEFHRIAPAKGHGASMSQERYGGVIQENVERLRSLGVRFVPSTQGWYKLRKGVRDCFSWIMIKRGASFDHDAERKLGKFSGLWATLKVNEAVLVKPTREFSDILKLDTYGDGHDLGTVRYKGVYEMVRSTKVDDILRPAARTREQVIDLTRVDPGEAPPQDPDDEYMVDPDLGLVEDDPGSADLFEEVKRDIRRLGKDPHPA